MGLFRQLNFFLAITRSHGILRRYFVVNGFDGALTMLGLIIGFVIGPAASLSVVISACLGTAIALGVSGVSSAYVSEVAERRRELAGLEGAMVRDLQGSAHGEAAYWVPILIAVVNGSAPLLISLLILLPVLLAHAGIALPFSPLYGSGATAFGLLFLLGVFLGHISGISYLRSGLQSLLIALITAILIYLFAGSQHGAA